MSAFGQHLDAMIFEATGIQFKPINSMYQVVAMREQKPQLQEAAQTLLFIPDLFNYLFTGVRKSEFSAASTRVSASLISPMATSKDVAEAGVTSTA